jgi:hypothetical protein
MFLDLAYYNNDFLRLNNFHQSNFALLCSVFLFDKRTRHKEDDELNTEMMG